MKKITHSAGGVVIGPNSKIVIVNQYGLSWSLPKGHIEEGESILEAAKREIEEETGLQKLEYITKLCEYNRYKLNKYGRDDTSEFKKITLFIFKTTETKLKPKDPDNPIARWVDIEEASAYITHKIDRKQYIQHIPQIKKVSSATQKINNTIQND